MRANSAIKRLSTIATCAIAGVMAFTLMMPPPAEAATAAELQAAAAATLDKLDTLQQKLDEASTEYQDAVTAQEEAQGKIEEASVKIADLQDKLSTRARGMYRSGALSILDVLTSSTSFQAFTSNWDLLNDMNQSDANMVQETKELRAVVEEQERVEAEKAAVAAEVKAEAESLVNEAQATYDALSAEAAAALEAERQARDAENLRLAQAAIANGTLAANGGSGSAATGGYGNSSSPTYYNGAASYNAGDAIGNAYSMLGQSYVWGGAAPGGFDCSGFVGWCLSGGRQGTDAYYGSWPQTNDPQPGDVCYRDGHVGLYVGNGKMIHASTYGVGVIESAVEPGMTYHRQ